MFVTQADMEGIETGEAGYQRRVGDRLAASYVNFYIANGGIIVPAFGDPYDADACHLLQNLFPNRRVVSVLSREILLGGGNIHCITQQQPAYV
jgi:agmatine deiminase